MIDAVLTGTAIADAICVVDQLPSDMRESMRTKIKHLVKRNFLKNEIDLNATATSPKYYRKRELARAAILTDALIFGFETEGLAEIAAALDKLPKVGPDHPPSADVGSTYDYGNGLDSAIKGVLANDPGRWLLEYSFGRNRETGAPVWHAYVTYVPEGVERFDRTLLGSLLRRQISEGTFNLTERFKAFGWMLQE